MNARPAAGGGRWVTVAPARLPGWLAGFGGRHGPPEITVTGYGVRLAAPDGATAELHRPPGAPAAADLDRFVAAAREPRRLGLLLARRGAVAAGIADGDRLVASKVDTYYVQGRTAAGGRSQQRFARRRANQAKAAVAGAADIAARVLLPRAGSLAALVAGGDRGTVDAILSDRRLAPLTRLRDRRLLEVPEPRHAVLVDAVAAARAVRVLIREPVPDPASERVDLEG